MAIATESGKRRTWWDRIETAKEQANEAVQQAKEKLDELREETV